MRLCEERRERLDMSCRVWRLVADVAAEVQAIREVTQLARSPDLGHDLTSVHRLMAQHKVLYILLFSFRFSLVSPENENFINYTQNNTHHRTYHFSKIFVY